MSGLHSFGEPCLDHTSCRPLWPRLLTVGKLILNQQTVGSTPPEVTTAPSTNGRSPPFQGADTGSIPVGVTLSVSSTLMPTYEYKCKACEKTWEQDQSIKEPPAKDCPHCGKPEAQRLISGGVNFQLMGGGWSGEGYSK